MEMNVNIPELIQYITWLATERGDVLSPIRMVKFLYLADLYFARKNEGKTLTGWPWRFVHYGPFCSECLNAIDEAVNRGLIAAISYESSFDEEEHLLYKCELEEQPDTASKLPFYVLGPLQTSIKKWADDTFALLDHIYFETEPMKNVDPGDTLDFSTAKEPEPFERIQMKKLSRNKIAEGRALIAKMREKQAECMIAEPEQIHDAAYYQALNYLDGEALELSVEGEAEIEDKVKAIE
jgi:hypothetical protein